MIVLFLLVTFNQSFVSGQQRNLIKNRIALKSKNDSIAKIISTDTSGLFKSPLKITFSKVISRKHSHSSIFFRYENISNKPVCDASFKFCYKLPNGRIVYPNIAFSRNGCYIDSLMPKELDYATVKEFPKKSR